MKKKIVLFVLLIVLIYGCGGVIYYFATKEKPVVIEEKDTIEKYNYSLKSNATQVYESVFNNLKAELEKEEVDYRVYAENISKLFIIDLYTLNNKINKYDIGGVEFVYPDAQANFKLNVQNTLYKYLTYNETGKNNGFPEVSDVQITESKEDKFKIGDVEYQSYVIKMSISYTLDMGYDTEAEVIVIVKDDKCYVVEKN